MRNVSVLLGLVLFTMSSFVSFAALELYARHCKGYFLWDFPLFRSKFHGRDALKIWNRRFYEEDPQFFRGWPVLMEFFDADQSQPRYLFKPNLRMKAHGGLLVPARPGEKVFWSSNSWGFRSPEFSVPKPAGVIRIVCLGASTTEGSQSDETTYPYFLQVQMNELFPGRNIEVINAGHHGMTVLGLLEILRQRVLSIQPDIVLFYEANNDLYFDEFVFPRRRCVFEYYDCWLESLPPWFTRLYKNSAFFKIMVNRFYLDSLMPQPMSHRLNLTSPKISLTRYKETLREMARECRQKQVILMLSSFVTLAHDRLKISFKRTPGFYEEVYPKRYPLTPGDIQKIYGCFNQGSAEVAAEFGLPYADVASEYPKDIRYMPEDLIHFSPDGNRLLANLFARFLAREVVPQILLARSDRSYASRSEQ